MYEMESTASETNQTYIQLLIDTSKKKLDVLKNIMDITETQEKLMTLETFDQDMFSQTIDQKEELLSKLIDLDTGFEQIYDRTKEELLGNKYRYEVEIKALQEYIASLTSISVKLQALEQRNKSKLELILTDKRREIKKSKVSNQTAANYYKTMTKQHEVQSFFYDKKK